MCSPSLSYEGQRFGEPRDLNRVWFFLSNFLGVDPSVKLINAYNRFYRLVAVSCCVPGVSIHLKHFSMHVKYTLTSVELYISSVKAQHFASFAAFDFMSMRHLNKKGCWWDLRKGKRLHSGSLLIWKTPTKSVFVCIVIRKLFGWRIFSKEIWQNSTFI